MCRFVLYQGPPLTLASLITEPSNSIINQSIHSREQDEPLNGDGFGVAWYVPEISPAPAAFRALTPAWNSRNLIDLARVTRSGTILAHVRAATRGGADPSAGAVTELNCHPFVAGPYAFMHNGDVSGFARIRRRLLSELSDQAFDAVHGATDSEHVFGVFLDRARAAAGTTDGARGGAARDGADALAAALRDAIEHVLDLQRAADVADHETTLNIAVSDGKRSAVCRYSTGKPEEALSLHVHTGRRYVCDGGLCRMVNPERGQGAVLVSSERLSDDPGWQVVPPNHMVVVYDDYAVDVRAWGKV